MKKYLRFSNVVSAPQILGGSVGDVGSAFSKAFARTMATLLLLLCVVGGVWGQSMANYTYATNTSGSLEDISTGATSLMTGNNDAAATAVFPIGFNFTFMGTTYSHASANSDGQVRLHTSAGATAMGTSVSTYTAGTATLALFSGDNEVNNGMSYKLVGTAPNRKLVVEWNQFYVQWQNLTNAGNMQLWIEEGTGVISYVYGAIYNSNTASVTRSIFLSSGSAANQSGSITIGAPPTFEPVATTPVVNTIALGANPVGSPLIANIGSSAQGSRRVFTFTPPAAPADPGASLVFSNVRAGSMLVGWTDLASNELGYLVQISTDNVNFSTAVTTGANGTSATIPGLTANTLYYFRVYAFNEGALSANYGAGSQTTSACPTPGTYSVGPTGTYPNLTAALGDINACPLTGAYVLELQAAYTVAGETTPFTLNSNSGSSATNTVTIRPEAGVTTPLTIAASSSYTFLLRGASYVTFDGRPGGAGTSKMLNISNTNAAGNAIWLANDASNNTFTYLTASGSGSTGVANAVFYFGVASGFTAVTGVDNNTISNCDIKDNGAGVISGIYGFSSTTTAAQFNSGNIVTNNNIYNIYSATLTQYGVYMGSGSTDWTITNNSFYQTATRTPTAGATAYSVFVSNTGSNFNISNNSIGGTAPLAGGTAWTVAGSTVANRFVGIYCSASGTGTAAGSGMNSIQGNTITNMNLSSSSGATTIPGVWGGIYFISGSANIGTTTGNVIGSGTAVGSVTVASSTNLGISTGIVSAAAGTVNISNNTIGGLTLSGTTTSFSHGFLGITSGTSHTSLTINNNLIGSLATANSINANTAATVAPTVTRLINVTAANTVCSITNNTIANINHANVNTAASTSNLIIGINATSGVNTITGNTVRNITTPANLTGTTGTAGIIGLLNTSGTAGQTVSNNSVYALANTHASAATQVVGIHYSSATTGANMMASNRVYNLAVASSSATATLYGINIGAGLLTAQNNTVRLGYSADGTTSLTNNIAINGINEVVVTAGTKYLHNTVYVGGTGVGAGAVATNAMNSGSTNARTYQNNIFVNARSNGAGTGVHAAFRTTSTTGLTSNYNDLQAPGTGGVVGFSTSARTLITDWRTATSQDANSISADPLFAGATSATPDLHLTVGTPCDGVGLAGTGVMDDFEGEIRANLSAVDLGADAGNYGPAGVDVGVNAVSRPLATTTCHSAAEPVIVTLTNFSSNPIDFSATNVTINTVVSGVVTDNFTQVLNTGTLAAGAAMSVTMGNINTTVAGNYTFATTTTATGDVNAANNNNNTTVAVAIPATLAVTVAATGGGLTICSTAPTATTLTATVTGGVAPFTYAWANSAATTAAITGLTPATMTNYSLVVTDACGLTASPTAASTTVAVVDCQYTVTRTEGITYNSIIADGTGLTFKSGPNWAGNEWSSTSSGDDIYTPTIRLTGTTFKFQGKPVNGIVANSNGSMTLDTTSKPTGAYGSLTTNTRILAPYATDLVLKGNLFANANASMRYRIDGTLGSGSAVIIVEWAEMEGFGFTNPNLNFQVVLRESDNSIEYNYGQMQRYDGGANNSGTVSTSLAIGLNGFNSGTNSLNERMILQRSNTNYFASVGNNANISAMLLTPACNSQLRYVPASAYTGTDPGAPVATNDEVSGGIPLSVNPQPCSSYCGTFYSSKTATASASITACSATPAGNADDDVWFRFTASTNTPNHRIVVTPSGSYDAVFQVFDNTNTPIACYNAAGAGLTEQIASLALTMGADYSIRVYDAGTGLLASTTNSGEFAICVSEVISPPNNDDPAGATVLTIGGTCTATNSELPATLSATATAGITACGAGTPGVADDDVWYKFTTLATAGLNYTIKVTGVSTYNPVVQSFTGTAAALTSVTCVNNTANGAVETIALVNPAVSTDYFVRVYNSAAGSANGNFNICVTVDPPVCPTIVTGTGNSPVNAAVVDAATPPTLRWRPSVGASGYNVYFGTSATPVQVTTAQTDTFYTVPALAAGNTYYWRIEPTNGLAANTTCTVNNFSTAIPACATAQTAPLEATTACAGSLQLRWPAVTLATSYDVYLDAGTSASTLVTNVATNSYTPTFTTSGAYAWKIVPKNVNGGAAGCATWTYTLSNALPLTTTPATRCGTGTVTLGATANSGDDLNWYAAATGGVPVANGTSYTTPSISATTNYYVAATSGGVTLNGGKPSTNGADGTNTTGGISFTANSAFTLSSVRMYPTGAGANTIVLYAGTNVTSGTALQTATYTFAGANSTTGEVVPLGWTIPAGTYTIYQSVSGASCYRDPSGGASLPATAYPYNIGSAVTLTDGTLAGYYYFFYDWSISTGCEGSRVAVAATVTAPPALTTDAATATVCSGASTTVNVTSTVADYDSYTWLPATGVTGTSSATFAPTVTSSTTTNYTLTASNSSTGCVNTKSFVLTANPSPAAPTVTLSSAACVDATAVQMTASGSTSAGSATIGTGVLANTGSTPYKGFWGSNKAQQLYTAAELSAAGLQAGSSISSLGFNISAFTSPYTYTGFTIAMKNTTTTTLSTTLETGTAEVLASSNYTLTGTAPFTVTHTLTTPFVWDGTSNLLVETCFNNNDGGGATANSASVVSSTTTGQSVYYSADNTTTTCAAPGVGTVVTTRPNAIFGYANPASYVWSGLTGLFTNAGATTAYTGTATNNVYAKPTATTTYTATATNSYTCSAATTQVVTVCAGGVTFKGKVYLENVDPVTGLMPFDVANAEGLPNALTVFPTTSPYSTTTFTAPTDPNSIPFAQVPAGAAMTTTMATIIANSIVDWVFVELRTVDPVDPGLTAVTYARPALLKSDGTIVDMDGTSDVSFPTATVQNYFVSIRHRNHLAFRTQLSYSPASLALMKDFTNGSVPIYGTNSVKETSAGAGIYKMYGGDANFDGSVDAFDNNSLWTAQTGNIDDYYLNADYNMDGSVDALDTNSIWKNNTGNIQQVDLRRRRNTNTNR
jgi:hypothetical protein